MLRIDFTNLRYAGI